MHKWFIAILIMALLPCLLQGQETELKSTKAKAAVREYERKVEDVDKEFEKQLKDLEKSYQMKSELIRARLITNLNAAMEEEARKINLEEANKIKGVIDETKEMKASTPVRAFVPSKPNDVKTPKIDLSKINGWTLKSSYEHPTLPYRYETWSYRFKFSGKWITQKLIHATKGEAWLAKSNWDLDRTEVFCYCDKDGTFVMQANCNKPSTPIVYVQLKIYK